MYFKTIAEFDAQAEQAMRAVLSELDSLQSMGGEPTWLGAVASFDAKQNETAFKSEGAKSGAAWPSLLEGEGNMRGYVAWKRRNWPGRKMNVWRGDTRDSLRFNSSPDRVVRTSGRTIILGTKAPLAAKMQEGEKSSEWRRVYLKENTPVFPKGTRKRQRREAGTGRFASGHERVHKGRVTTGRHWFTFFYREIPPRPVVRKSPEQARQLKLALAKALMVRMAIAAGTGTAFARAFGRAAGQIRPDASA